MSSRRTHAEFDPLDAFELQPLEQRVMLSAEGLGVGLTTTEDPLFSELHTAAVVETTTETVAADETDAAAETDSADADDAFFPAAPLDDQDAETTESLEATASDNESAENAAVNEADGTPETPAEIAPTGDVFVVETFIPVNTYPNGPPESEAQALAGEEDRAGPTVSAATLDLAATFTTALSDLDAALATWGAFFDLGSIDWAGQGTSEVSLPVVPDELQDLFGLEVIIDSAALPDFSADETIDAFVSSLRGAGFTISAIDGGYDNGTTTIAATDGTSLLEGSYTLNLGSGFGVDGGFGGDSFNDSTAGVLNGLASGTSLDGSISWSGDLTLNLGFVLDSADGLLLTGDSAFSQPDPAAGDRPGAREGLTPAASSPMPTRTPTPTPPPNLTSARLPPTCRPPLRTARSRSGIRPVRSRSTLRGHSASRKL